MLAHMHMHMYMYMLATARSQAREYSFQVNDAVVRVFEMSARPRRCSVSCWTNVQIVSAARPCSSASPALCGRKSTVSARHLQGGRAHPRAPLNLAHLAHAECVGKARLASAPVSGLVSRVSGLANGEWRSNVRQEQTFGLADCCRASLACQARHSRAP